ncbi:MAG TPA: DsbA family protein [Rickettsiales bacterium]|nr:DsbA family protein [Rickettsiales bacterium]
MKKLCLALACMFTAASACAQEIPPSPPSANTSAPASASANPAPVPATPAKPFVYVPGEYDITIGKKNAPVTIVEYASLSCPHCAHFFTDTYPALKEKYIDTGKARLVYRDYPLNAPALKAAQLVHCVEPDRRHEFVEVLFKMQSKWAYNMDYMDALANIAALGGVEKAKFDQCTSDTATENALIAIEKQAADEYKVNSTPTFFINGKEYQGDRNIDGMGKAIEGALSPSVKK